MTIDSLIPYSVMKDSGVPWLGYIPKHWKVWPLSAIARMKSITGKPDRELLSVYLDRGVIRFSEVDEKRTNVTSEDLSKYQVVDPGDFVLNNQQAWRGSVGVSKYAGIISPAYLVLSLDGRIDPVYANLLFRDKIMVDQYLVCSRGVGSIQRNLYWPSLRRVFTLLPSRSEQAAIVRYLDYMDRRIRRYIRTKQKLIKLLEEQKQAIIHRAVTRGLDPNVRLKPSGVEWLGGVPEHWVIKPLKRWAMINACTLTERTDPDFEFRYIDIGTVHVGRLVRAPSFMRFKNAPSRARRILRKGDTIVSTVRTYLKAIWYVTDETDDLIASTGFAVLSPRGDIEPEYLGNVVQSKNFVDRVTANSVGTAYPAIVETVLARFPVAMPPTKHEQQDLIRYIKMESAPTNLAIKSAHREIELLREYRTRLIADVVTGKLDVREVAARLPDETDESEPIDETDELNGTEEATADDLDAKPEEEIA